MDSQKLENILNLSLDSTMEERDKSLVLNVGFDQEDQTWELIVKYNGDISRLNSERISVEVLLAGYAIIRIPESLIPALTQLDEIEYVEKPRELLYDVYEAKRQACFPLPVSPYGELTGKGCLIAVLDSGVDYTLPDFIDASGSRIVDLWDQTLKPDPQRGFYPPAGFLTGVEFTREKLNEALQSKDPYSVVPSIDVSGHGTAVAAIAAGSNANARYTGAAPGALLLIVKLGQPVSSGAGRAGGGYPKTTQLMRAAVYALRKAQQLAMPLVINLSFGNNYGAHDGSSLLERFMDNASEVWKTVICVGSGNEGASAGHTSGHLDRVRRIELAVGDYESTINVQLWKNYVDRFGVTLLAPSGKQLVIDIERQGRQVYQADETQILVYAGEPSPYSVNQELYFDFLPVGTFVNAGIWTFILDPITIVRGEYQMYLPGQAVRTASTRFFTPEPELTLTIPSTASKLLTVGAVNGVYDAYADFSGRGVSVSQETAGFPGFKPDIAAPGVNIVTARAGGGYEAVTGTSFATPLVSGAAALMMEWGIVIGNDPYLYGEKVKARLRRGAKSVRGEAAVPNPKVGYGALCVEDSLPK